MRALPLLAALACAALVLGTGGAAHCTTWTTSSPEIDTVVGLGSNGYYVDNDLCQPGCLFSVWFYQETNDIPGLQRHDDGKDDTCHEMIESDTIVT